MQQVGLLVNPFGIIPFRAGDGAIDFRLVISPQVDLNRAQP